MTDARRVSATALRWLILSEWRAFPVRVILAVLAIAMGVALGFAVHLINASALSEFDHAVRTVNGDADLQIHATSVLGFNESLYPKLARVQGVAQASPVVELSAQAGDKTQLKVVGLDVLRAATVTPRLLGRRGDGGNAPGDLFGDHDVYLSAAALQASHSRIGDVIKLTAAGHAFDFRVVGDLPGVDADQSLAVMDVAAAQWRFGQVGRLQRVDLRLYTGADRSQVLAAISAVLPVGAEIVSRQSQERSSNELSRAYRVNLDMLALMALLTGGFLVYSAQALSVARRRPQFALMRVLGLERRALLAQVFVEATAVGGLGAITGLVLGVGIAYGALHFMGSDLGGGYFVGAVPRLTFALGPAAAFGGLGLAASFIGSLLPAREAARSQPAIALKNLGDAVDPRIRPRAWPGLLLLVAGAAAALAPPLFGLPILGYASIALMLAGGVMAMPWIARVLLSPLRRIASLTPAMRLALERLWGAPSQASIALSGIVASTSLMIAMAVMVASFRGSVENWLYQILPADLYLALDNSASGAGFDASVQAGISRVPGVAWAGFLKNTSLRLAPGKPPVSLLARPVSGPAGKLPLQQPSLPIPSHEIPVWVSEPAAGIYGYRPGDHIVLPIPGLATRVFVAGIWRDYGNQQGAIVIDGATYTRLTGDALRSVASIALEPGASEASVVRDIKAALPPALRDHLDVGRPRDIRAKGLAAFDRSFAITYLLEAIPILVGLIGVAATISAQTLARTKEFGMLRHVGVMRRQIVVMLVTEGALLGVIGGVAGISLGLGMSQVLIHVVNPQSFHWTMDTRIPWWLLISVITLLVLATAGTARLAGGRALSSDAVRAVREDW
jgi:putative ABC transport system permease protein